MTPFKPSNTPLSGGVLEFDPGCSHFLLRTHFLQMNRIPIKMMFSMETLTQCSRKATEIMQGLITRKVSRNGNTRDIQVGHVLTNYVRLIIVTCSFCSDETWVGLAHDFWQCHSGYQEVCFQGQLCSKSVSIELDNHTLLQRNWKFQSWPSSLILNFFFFLIIWWIDLWVIPYAFQGQTEAYSKNGSPLEKGSYK